MHRRPAELYLNIGWRGGKRSVLRNPGDKEPHPACMHARRSLIHYIRLRTEMLQEALHKPCNNTASFKCLSHTDMTNLQVPTRMF